MSQTPQPFDPNQQQTLLNSQEEPAPPQHGKPKKRKRHIGLIITLILIILVIIGLIAGGLFVSRLQSAFKSATVFPQEQVLPSYEGQPVKDPGDDSMNILLLGADRSQDGAAPDLTAKGTDQRSDTMMILHIPQGHDAVYLMSMVRDTYVNIPGHGKAKLNAALSYGGVPLLRRTIEGMLDVPIDHVAMVDFQSFEGLSTAIGGVTVNNPKAFCAYKTTPEVCFDQGKITIEGKRALKWVRERHAFPTGDYQRVKNQQQFLKAMFSKTLSKDVITSPTKITNVLEQVMPYVTMDSGLQDQGMLAGLAWQMRDVRGDDIHSFTLPTAGSSSAGGASIELNSPEWDQKVGEAMRKGTMSTLYAELPTQFKG